MSEYTPTELIVARMREGAVHARNGDTVSLQSEAFDDIADRLEALVMLTATQRVDLSAAKARIAELEKQLAERG